jgi:hypothetical protein
MSEPIAVPVREGACPCPGTPHTGEIVYLRQNVSVALGTAATNVSQAVMNEYLELHPDTRARLMDAADQNDKIRELAKATLPDATAGLAEVYLEYGIVGWTFTDAQGKPRQITPETIAELLPWDEGGMEVGERADTLYSDRIFAPLARRSARLSPPGPTEPPTSPIPLSGHKRPKRSKRSSQTETAGRPSAVRAS